MFQSFEPASDRSFAAAHVPPLRAALSDAGLDGFLVPHDDAYLNEYLPDDAERLMWVSGFSGSAGFGIILIEKAAVFSDGRYTIQLTEQVDTAFFELHNTADTTPEKWLRANAPTGAKIGYDPLLHSRASLAPFEAAAARAGFSLVAVEANPIDTAWTDQPAPPMAPVRPHPLDHAGESAADKRARIGRDVAETGAEAVLLTAPTSLAWLFNIRGGDVHASPLPLGRAVLFTDGTAELFLAPPKVTDGLTDHLGPDVTLLPEDDLYARLSALGAAKKKVLVDPALAPIAFLDRLTAAGATLVEGRDPCALPRAIKNKAELDGSRTAHIRDGAIVTRFLKWLAEEAPKGGVTEISAAQKLESLRRDSGVLQDISFDTISGAGAHGALPHYRVTTPTDRPLELNSLYLVDSGGQYEDGTTDITRVIAVGTPTEEMRRHYTLVLKGHIALALMRFPRGTSGHQLDAFARQFLWMAGYDYDHGTGHGVGSYLGVHEGPQNISKKLVGEPLRPGMICSNEPGYYKAGEYGIRIENLVIVTEPAPIPGGDREMMGFETITMAPLERELIDVSLLTETERDWVDRYHAEVRNKLTPDLDADTAAWLADRTARL